MIVSIQETCGGGANARHGNVANIVVSGLQYIKNAFGSPSGENSLRTASSIKCCVSPGGGIAPLSAHSLGAKDMRCLGGGGLRRGGNP